MDSHPSPPPAVDPAFLPPGTRVGPWRIRGWGGRGAYGTVYRVEREGNAAAGSFAFKLAHGSRDERSSREVELLSRIHHPHIPGLVDHGVWHHRSGDFPYLVMEWIEGTPLYDWAERHAASWREMARVLAAAARALEATHAAAAVHRDVKGDNVLVRLADGHPFLTDFGAGNFRGATTLTSRLLPPGTPAYRSPEAWGFVRLFSRHPTIHYPASACDDLFALGVTAYRLVTGVYPPSTHPQEQGAEVWREGGSGPLPPRALNTQVSPELDAIILRLLAVAPEERFNGKAREAAEALEQAARGRRAVSHSSKQDAAVQEELQRPAREVEPSSVAAVEQSRSAIVASSRFRRCALVAGVLLFAVVAGVSPHGDQEVPQTWARDSRQGGSVAVGDSSIPLPITTLSTAWTDACVPVVGSPMPAGPFPDQRTPPCNKGGEEEIRGGCWYALRDFKPPCGEDAYEWKGACYLPSFPPRRRPAAELP